MLCLTLGTARSRTHRSSLFEYRSYIRLIIRPSSSNNRWQ